MDQKTWLWRKKSTEKIVVAAATDKSNSFSHKETDHQQQQEEMEILLTEKAELENELKNLSEKLSAALSECNAKEDLAKKQRKMSEEAMEGRKKAEAKAASLKQELDAALQQRTAGEERLVHLDGALKECMQQLQFVRQEQERRIHDAVMKTAKEFEKSQKILEERLSETNKRLGKIVVENSHLSKALTAKEKLINDLSKQKAQVEAELNGLMSRLESIEKDNASITYELRVLDKELEIRNEEREFTRRTAEASHKQHLESMKKIAKLESECQRLRLLVRKRLPGPAALAKMKSEIELLGRDPVEVRRKRSNSSPGLAITAVVDNTPNTPSKKIAFLIEQLSALEEDNRALRDALDKKATELQFSRAMYVRSASQLSQVGSHFDDFSKTQLTSEPSRRSLAVTAQEISLPSMSDIGSDDKASCAESWASALISELDNFKHDKLRGSPLSKTMGTSNMSLMDDFAEMERLAIVSIGKESGSPHFSSEDTNAVDSPLNILGCGYSSALAGREVTQDSDYGSGRVNQEIKSNDISTGKSPDWLANIVKVLVEQSHASQRKPDEILEEVKVALANMSQASVAEHVDTKEGSKPNDVDGPLTEMNGRHFQSDLGKSMQKIIELIEGTSLLSPDYSTQENLSKKDESFFQYKNSDPPSGFIVRVFQWKTSEISAVLRQFVHSCHELLNGKSDMNKFAEELSTALEWIMNHCFSLQDVSSMKDAIKKHFDWDETRSESEETGVTSQLSEADKAHLSVEHNSHLPIIVASNGHSTHFEKEEFQSAIIDDNKKFKDELNNSESMKVDLECKLINKSEALMDQLQKSEKTITCLRTELENLKNSKETMESQIENHKLMKEDLDARLTMARAELNEARHKVSSFEIELDNKTSCYEELEATCLELQLQLESVTKKTIPNGEHSKEDKQLRTEREITAASEKLAECQETILNLGKQLKALASPKDAALFNKVITTPNGVDAPTVAAISTTNEITTTPKIKNTSLLDRMIAEDDAVAKNAQSTMREPDEKSNLLMEPAQKILLVSGSKHHKDGVPITSLAVVPSKKHGGRSFWKKLLWRRKSSNSKKPPIPFVP